MICVVQRFGALLGRVRVPGLALLAVLILAADASAQTESEMRDRLCAGLAIEVGTPAGTRIDCVSATHAIEVDWSEKWAEAIGQALHYAEETGLAPGIVLVCRDTSHCLAHSLRLEATLAYWRLPVTVWFCEVSAATLGACAAQTFP